MTRAKRAPRPAKPKGATPAKATQAGTGKQPTPTEREQPKEWQLQPIGEQ